MHSKPNPQLWKNNIFTKNRLFLCRPISVNIALVLKVRMALKMLTEDSPLIFYYTTDFKAIDTESCLSLKKKFSRDLTKITVMIYISCIIKAKSVSC